jgi:hypothetical protein
LKQDKLCFGEECLGLLDEKKQAKMQWLQDTNQRNVDNLNNVRCKASRHFRNKKKESLKAKTDELEINNKIQISKPCTGAAMISRRGISLYLL